MTSSNEARSLICTKINEIYCNAEIFGVSEDLSIAMKADMTMDTIRIHLLLMRLLRENTDKRKLDSSEFLKLLSFQYFMKYDNKLRPLTSGGGYCFYLMLLQVQIYALVFQGTKSLGLCDLNCLYIDETERKKTFSDFMDNLYEEVVKSSVVPSTTLTNFLNHILFSQSAYPKCINKEYYPESEYLSFVPGKIGGRIALFNASLSVSKELKGCSHINKNDQYAVLTTNNILKTKNPWKSTYTFPELYEVRTTGFFYVSDNVHYFPMPECAQYCKDSLFRAIIDLQNNVVNWFLRTFLDDLNYQSLISEEAEALLLSGEIPQEQATMKLQSELISNLTFELPEIAEDRLQGLSNRLKENSKDYLKNIVSFNQWMDEIVATEQKKYSEEYYDENKGVPVPFLLYPSFCGLYKDKYVFLIDFHLTFSHLLNCYERTRACDKLKADNEEIAPLLTQITTKLLQFNVCVADVWLEKQDVPADEFEETKTKKQRLSCDFICDIREKESFTEPLSILTKQTISDEKKFGLEIRLPLLEDLLTKKIRVTKNGSTDTYLFMENVRELKDTCFKEQLKLISTLLMKWYIKLRFNDDEEWNLITLALTERDVFISNATQEAVDIEDRCLYELKLQNRLPTYIDFSYETYLSLIKEVEEEELEKKKSTPNPTPEKSTLPSTNPNLDHFDNNKKKFDLTTEEEEEETKVHCEMHRKIDLTTEEEEEEETKVHCEMHKAADTNEVEILCEFIKGLFMSQALKKDGESKVICEAACFYHRLNHLMATSYDQVITHPDDNKKLAVIIRVLKIIAFDDARISKCNSICDFTDLFLKLSFLVFEFYSSAKENNNRTVQEVVASFVECGDINAYWISNNQQEQAEAARFPYLVSLLLDGLIKLLYVQIKSGIDPTKYLDSDAFKLANLKEHWILVYLFTKNYSYSQLIKKFNTHKFT